MRRKIIGILLLSFFLSSCTKDEKKLATLFESIKKNKIELIENKRFPNLVEETLILLKSYSDSLTEGSELLRKVIKKKSSKKKIYKYLSKTQGVELICSVFFIELNVLKNLKEQCSLEFFDICPLSFSKYQQNTKEMMGNLQNIIGEDFNKTDCYKYIKKEISND